MGLQTTHLAKARADVEVARGIHFRGPFLLVFVSLALVQGLELALQLQQILIHGVHLLTQLLHLTSMPFGNRALMITQDGNLQDTTAPST